MLRDVLYSLDPDLALYDIAPLTEITESFIAPQQFLAVLLSILAGIALLLAAAGTYGMMSYMVAGVLQRLAYAARWERTGRTYCGWFSVKVCVFRWVDW